eukprot:GHRQ01030433.1.p1 GENE.GHRQ01030433.1~~GHRQ01030433.1.p1  ORF type:complete len:126 (-),score=33.14 GHRQ01030433.1:111-488(-)
MVLLHRVAGSAWETLSSTVPTQQYKLACIVVLHPVVPTLLLPGGVACLAGGCSIRCWMQCTVILSLLTALAHLVLLHTVPPPWQVYCLPDNYEVADRSLDDIRAVLNPTFTREVRASSCSCCSLV